MSFVSSFLSVTADTSDTSAYVIGDQSLGTPSSGRHIVIGVSSRKAGADTTISSITVAGVVASIAAVASNNVANTDIAALAIAHVPTGTVGSVVVGFEDTMVRAIIGAWQANSVLTASTYSALTDTSADPTVTLDVPALGGVFGVGMSNSNSSATWSGLNEDYDTTVESFVTATGASSIFGESSAVGILIDFASAGTEDVGVFASWESKPDGPDALPYQTFKSQVNQPYAYRY